MSPEKTSIQRTVKTSRCFMKSGENLNIKKDNRVYKIKFKNLHLFSVISPQFTKLSCKSDNTKMFRFIKRPNSPWSQYFWPSVLDTHRNLGQDISMLALLTLHWDLPILLLPKYHLYTFQQTFNTWTEQTRALGIATLINKASKALGYQFCCCGNF